MRAAEVINLAFFLFLIALAWQRPLAARRRVKVTVSALAAIILISCAQFLGRMFSTLSTSVIRDWLPALLFLIAYRTAGLFFIAPNEKLQGSLARLDKKIFGQPGQYRESGLLLRPIAAYFEFAYLFCYPLLPFGIGALYLAHMGRHADEFWTIVLPSAYLCFAALPFVQTLPPRMLPAAGEPILPPTRIRMLNLWILHNGSIQVNTFPSAHVATALSISFALLRFLPQTGIVFLWISISISVGAVLGRYHYAADALLGAAVAIAVFLLQGIL